ncbi:MULTISPECIES: M15 family metallopeptidase [Mycolicibacterium]|uniref:D-alanyl-D-alanine dipeptidase n=1 Tax=Mycolicibacterium senegalense TaxID=1796 RepID=A0A378SVV6_9MYCO|nr:MULTISPECIES: M15 family metallopeptidase [Mycolicibacterium]MCV7333890.1 D-alanyl-D-alanine dipeptidase [Mycolicibacterium senegalense]MDR7292473.1 D-alanyl-D-alanine dipeptidase [Mycolicibacterium senegalense]QZA23836.1 M15 family metallopeptidase [Mycolicibacterium senegalense]CDP88307.1 D-alanyl-D-alanine dipeptidase [Mycolicibacterium farcinogenes]STZ51650.1 peptidase M15D vanX D-ala-D-ala dipeptidase [Mycolicibacterium senegalense]
MPEEESVISAGFRSWAGAVLTTAAVVVPLVLAPASAARPAADAGLVDVRTVVPDAVIDLRYATADNFVGQRLYPPGAPCLVHESMAAGLATAAAVLRPQTLVFWDCYRPHEVQVRMFEVVSNPNWVAQPGPYARSHEAGRSVDVTIAGAEMGTGFDDFTERSRAYATDGISPVARANRTRLREAMSAGGLTVYSGEWWHFDGPGAADPRPYLDVPLE